MRKRETRKAMTRKPYGDRPHGTLVKRHFAQGRLLWDGSRAGTETRRFDRKTQRSDMASFGSCLPVTYCNK